MRSDKLPARLVEQATQTRDPAFLPVVETQHL